jgi:hypothetical protein
VSDGIKITELPVIVLPYVGSEQFPIVQANETRVSTLSSLITYLSGALLADSELSALSGNWQSTYATVCALSTSWEESAEIIPTVTNYLSTNKVLLSSATVTDNISAGGSVIASKSIIPVTITTTSTNITFADTDTNTVFHFDTTSSPLTASFPGILTNGFNAAIMNIGTNYLYISSNIQYNAVGNKLIDRYSGAYVYKSNSNIFAVGGV